MNICVLLRAVLLRAVVVLAMAAASPTAFGVPKTWDGGGGNQNWGTANNWNPDGLPNSSDDVTINTGSGIVFVNIAPTVKSITVENAAELRVLTGQVLTVSNASTVDSGGTLRVVDGTFTGAGALTVNGDFILVDGALGGSGALTVNGIVFVLDATLGGSGAVTINSGGELRIESDTNVSVISRTTTNAGTIRFLSSSALDTTFDAATLTNTGTILIQNDQDINPGLGSPVLNNNSGGVISKSVGSGSAAIDFPVNNAAGATIQAQSGTLELNDGGTVSGAYSISSGDTLSLSGGTFTTSGSPTLAGPGTFSVASGASLDVNAGTFTMSGNPTVSGSVSIGGGTLNAGAGVDVTWTNVNLSSGTITGAGIVRVSGNFTWSGGTISGSGLRVLNNGSTPTISCSTANCLLDGSTLQFQASGTYSASSNALVFSNGASLILDPGRGLHVNNDGDFLNGGGAASSIVIGGFAMGFNSVIHKTTTTGTSIIEVPVTMSGSFKVDAGTIEVASDVTAAAGAIVHYSVGATLEITGGLFLLNSSMIGVPTNGDFKVSGGTLRLPTGVTLTMPNLTLQGSGVIDGGGTLILSGTSTWSGGTMGSATAPGGITQIDSGNTMNVSGTPLLAQNRVVLNNGTLNLPGTGTIHRSGFATIQNNGTIAKSAAGTTTLHPTVENNSGGTVSVAAGTLALSAGGIAGGAYSISSGATITLGGGTFTVANTATITGAGTLSIVNTGTLSAGAGVDVTFPNLTLALGTITGAGTVRVSGNFTWSGGTIAGSGPRVLNSTSVPTFSCSTGNCLLDGTTLQLQASATFSPSGNAIIFFNGASLTIDPGKTLEVTSDGHFLNGGGAASSIINSGTIWKSGAGTSLIDVPMTLSATSTVDIDNGTLQFDDDVTVAAGAILDIASGRTLEVTNGMFQLNGSASMPGGGDFKVSFGMLRVFALTTIPNLTLQGGIIDGSGDLHVSGNFAWLGGTIAGSGARVLNSTSTPTISCSAGNCLLDGAALQLQASATFSASTNALVFSNGASLTIDPGKTLSITADGDFSSGVGGGTIFNNGTITKSGSGTADINVTVNNPAGATIQVQTGNLALNGGGTTSGAYSISATTFLHLGGGTFTMSGTPTVTGAGRFSIVGATLDAGAGIDVTLPDVDLFSGTITGAGAVRVSGDFDWFGGTISGSGLRVLNSTSTPTINCSAGNCLLDGAALQIQAWGTYSASSNALVLSNGANLILDPGKVLFVTNDGDFVSGGGAASSIVVGGFASGANGCIQKTTTSGTSIIGVPVTLSGSFMTVTGTLQIAADVTVAAAGAIVHYDVGTTIEITGGVFLFNSGAVSFPANGDFKVSAGTLRVPTGITLTIPNVTLEGSGVIDGAGAVHLSGNFNWSGGTIAGSGPRVLVSTSVPTISCSAGNCLLDGATLQTQAWGTYSASSNALVLSNGANLILDPGKVLFVTNDGDFVSGGGAASSITIGGFAMGVNGCIEKTTTSGTSIIGVPVTMAGSFKTVTGTLQVAADVTASAGAIVHVDPGTTVEVTGGLFLLNSSAISFPANGDFKVSGGTLRVPTGITITIPNATLQGNSVIDGGGTLILSGTNQWHGGTMGSATAPGGITQIDSGASLSVNAVSPKSLTQTRQLLNNGTVNYVAVPPNHLTMSGNSTITNNNSLTLDSSISLSGSALIENNGTITKTAPGVNTTEPPLNNNAGATLNVNAGTLVLPGGGNAGGAYDISSGATLVLAGGTFTVAGTAAVTGAGTLSIAGATLDAGGGADLTCPNLTFSAGTITGAGAVRVSGNFTWSGGTITGSGPRVLNSTSVPTISCSDGNCLLDGAAFQLQAWATYSASSNALLLSNGANLILDPGQVLFVTNDGDFVSGGGAASSIAIGGFGPPGNNGCIVKMTTSGTSIIGVPVTMSGCFRTDSGTLQVAADVTADNSAVVFCSAGTTIEVTGGVFLLNSGAITFPANGDFKVSGGTLRVPTGVNVTARNVTLQGSGVIDGGGTLNLSGTSTWSAGTMSGSGTTVIPATMSLGITAPVALDRTLQNDGTLSVSGDITGSGTIDNGGTLNALANLTIGTVLNNSGQVVTSNALSLAGGGTHSGSFNVTTPGSVSFSAGTHSLSGGSIGGTGTLAVSGATVTVSSPFTVGALSVSAGTATLDVNGSADAFTLTGGTLGGSGILTLNNGGTWSGGTMSGSGETVNPATKTLSISAPVTLTSRTLQNDGTLDVNGDITGSGTIDNGGTLNALANLTIGTLLNNSGQVVTSNALALAGGGTHTGPFTITTPGNLSFSSGTHSMSGGGSIGGTGTLTFSGATATVGVPVNVGALNMTTGTATLGVNGSADAFTMTGGTLGGSGTLTLNEGGTWSGGAMSGSGTTVNPATKTLSISAPVTLDSRTLQSSGELSISGNVLGSGTIDNGGTLNAVADLTISAVLNNSGQVATSNALSLAGGGTHTGPFTITTPGNLSFSSGTHSMSGGSTIGGTGTLSFSGATATVGAPVNVGTMSVSAGTATLNANGSADAFTMTGGTLDGSGTLTLSSGGTWSGGTMSGSGTTINPAAMTLSIPSPVTLDSRILQNSGTLSISGNVLGTGTIDNQGTLNAVGNSAIGAAVNNSGQIATGDLLSLGGNGTHSGTFTATAPGVIDFSGGTQTISGALAGTGTVRFSGAAATVSGTWSGMPIEVAGGSVALNTNGTIPALTLSGGTLAGSGDVIVSGPSTWSGGTVAGSGAFTFDTGATVTMPGTNPVTLARPLVNEGTINFAAVANGMLIAGVAVTNNGTVDIQSSQGIDATAGTPPFVNDGTLKKSSDLGVMQFAAPLSNSSLVQIESGTMHFSGPYAQSAGTTNILSGATLQTTTLSLDGGALTGNGTVAGTVANHASVSPGASPGTLAIDGDYEQSPGGELNIQLDGTAPSTQYDRLLVSGSVILSGTLNVTTGNGFTPTAGNAFQIITFGSRQDDSTFDVMNGLTGSGTALVPTFSATDLQLITQGAADLGVSVGAPPSAAHGSTFAYTVGVFNGGGADANGVSVTATLPPNVTFTGASPPICSGAPNLVCGIGSLNSGSTATVVISVTADGTGAAPISVLATASELDSNTANNSASASTIITPVDDVSVVLTGPGSTIAGTKVIYTATVSNSGPSTATNIAVTATASPGLTFSANSGACAGSFPCTIGTLSSGQSATILTAWDIDPAATGEVQLTVNVSSAADANASNDSASAITIIGTCPTIAILAPKEMTSGVSAEATAPFFEGATYSWSIVNGTIDSGNGTASIEFTAGEPGTTSLAVNVTGGECTLGAAVDVTVKPRCLGTATPTTPVDGTSTGDAVVAFTWSTVDDASGYRLWLQQDGLPARNLGTALGTSRTRIIPPGTYRWYVETLFDGCASHESEHLALTILPAQDCHTRAAPQLSAPANETPATSAAVAFSWNPVDQALEYELWLASAGGAPTLIRATSDTSYTAVVPPGRLEWYVRAVFAGCAAIESAHRTFTYTQPRQCTSERPLLIAPVEGERLTSPVSFEWTNVSGATSYELYVDDVLAATTTSPHASGLDLPRAERRWQVRAHLAEGCGAADSTESRLVVIAPPPSCAPLGAPVISAPAQISTGIAGRIQWSFVAGATHYVVAISGHPEFPPESTSSSTVTTRQLPFTFTNQGSAPLARYVRVHAVDTSCVEPRIGAFSPVAELFVLPPSGSTTGNEGAAMMTDPTDVQYTLNIAAELAGQSFTATPTVPWISVTPASGVVPPGGQTLRAVAHSAGLPAGTNIGTVEITTTDTTNTATSGALKSLGTTSSTASLLLNNQPGSSNDPKSTPPPDALIIPAVAKVTNTFVSYDSDVSFTNASATDLKYEINFVPTGPKGMSNGQKTTIDIKSGTTMAVKEIVGNWFGGKSSTGTLEIRRQTEIDESTSSAPAGGLTNRTIFASSRTFSTTGDGGTYGQYIPAVPYGNFVAKGSTLSLQQIAQSDKTKVHTNLGLLEGSGEQVSLEVRIFDAAGTMQASFPHELNGGEHVQLNSVLKQHGLANLDDGRIEVEVTFGAGKMTAYASVIDDRTKDSQLVPAVTLGPAKHSRWVVPGVTGSGNSQTDVRVFNAGTASADLTLEFYSMNSGQPTTKTIQLRAGEVRQLDRVLSSFFGLPGDTGALHVSSAAEAQVVVTARTYQQTAAGTFGQFIVAATPDEAVSVGSRPLQILQMEESAKFKSNIGFAEVSGKPVTLKVEVFRPEPYAPAVLVVELKANEFRQLNSMLDSFGLREMYNARISVSAVDGGGEGRAVAYGSLIDITTGDPTYIPGQ